MSGSGLPRKIEKPWGYELLYALTPDYAGKLLFVRQGHRLSLQYHRKKDESMYLYQGKAIIEIEGNGGAMTSHVAEPGFCIHITPLMKHRVQAVEDTLLLEVSTSQLDDVERLADDYKRAP